MNKVNLKVNVREETGKEAVKKLRSAGIIPAVVYKGNQALQIKVPAKDFLKVIHSQAGGNVLVDLGLDEADKHKLKEKVFQFPVTAIIKEVQYHPVRGEVLHADFNEISLTEAIIVKVPIAVKGASQGVKEGGVLEHVLWEVEIECLPTQIPGKISVDVTALKIGDSVLVKDLQIPPDVKMLSDPQSTVVAVSAPHLEEAEAAKPEEGAPAEPEVIKEKKPKEEAEEGKPE
ncbi:MAG: 50S ribosomal protein L25 [Candidatus Omnitrophota bacterium]